VTITRTQTTSLVYGEVLHTYEIKIRVSFHVTKFASVFEIKQTRKNSKGKLLVCLSALITVMPKQMDPPNLNLRTQESIPPITAHFS
jgi:hypothetical protein